MKHQLLLSIFAILFAANTLVAQETPLMKRAKEFVAMENTASISIRDLMTEDFIDQTDDSNKAKFLKKIQERDAHFKNIRQPSARTVPERKYNFRPHPAALP